MATAVYAASTQPVGAAVTRDVISNNLDHYADSMGQVRLRFSAQDTAVYGSKNFLTPRTSSVTVDTWYQILTVPEFPIALRASGASYKVRVRLGGASSGGHAVKFAIVLAPVHRASEILAAINASELTTDAAFITSTRTSSTAAWMTGASQGTGAYTTMVGLTSAEAAAYIRETAVDVDLSGASSAVTQCMVALTVFGSTANTGSVPRLYGASGEEFPG